MENAALYFGIASSGTISQWLKAFRKNGINGLHPKPKGRPSMKPKYAKMPPPPKIEENRLLALMNLKRLSMIMSGTIIKNESN